MWLRCAAVVALALAAAPAADNVSRPVPSAHATQLMDRERIEGSTPALPWPTGAQSAVGATGFGVLEATPAARPLPTASVAKVMTALLTLERRPLRAGEQGPVLTITAQDVQDYENQVAQGGSVAPVVVGEQLTEYQALEALLLPSANNVAILLARWISGSVPAFVTLMNARARALGMTGTTFADSSGFDPSTVSVPADLVRLGQRAMANPVFAQIVDERQAVIPVAGTISNVNAALGRGRIVGIKTGNSLQARAVYLAAATYQPAGLRPILVYALVQGLETLADCFAAAQRLLLAVESALRARTIVSRGQSLGRYATAWGGASDVLAGADLEMLVWPGTTVTAELRAPALRAPARRGSLVGTLDVSLGGRAAAVPVVLAAGLAGPNALWLLTRSASISTLPPMELLTWLSLALAVAAVLLALAALLRAEIQGPNVRLQLVGRPARDAWAVSETPRAELSGTCVGLLTNSGSHAGAAWDFRVTVQGPDGARPAIAAVLPAACAPPAAGPGAPASEVIHVEPRSSVGVLVRLRLPLQASNTGAAPGGQPRFPGDLRVSVDCGATCWPWGRPGRRSSALAIPHGDLWAAVERWEATRAPTPEPGAGDSPAPDVEDRAEVHPAPAQGPAAHESRAPEATSPAAEAPPPTVNGDAAAASPAQQPDHRPEEEEENASPGPATPRSR